MAKRKTRSDVQDRFYFWWRRRYPTDSSIGQYASSDLRAAYKAGWKAGSR